MSPTSVRQLRDGSWMYTFPKNLVGTIEVAALPNAATGSRVHLQLGEWLTPVNAPYAPTPGLPPPPPASLIYPHISGATQQYENHTLQAGNRDPLTTLFCWHGFQYVRVTTTGATGFAGTLAALLAHEIHTNTSQTGRLRFGGDGQPGSVASEAARVLQGVNAMTLASQRTNVAAYMPTDCPTR